MDKSDIWSNLTPADLQQGFAQFNIRILCMHYWWLEAWKYQNLSLPFWRIYWNDREGAEIIHKGEVIKLDSKSIVVISPNTEFSSRLNTDSMDSEDFLYGGPRIENTVNIKKNSAMVEKHALNHFFLHFTLGMSNAVRPTAIYIFELTSGLKSYLDILTSPDTGVHGVFSLRECMLVSSFITAVLSLIPDNEWGGDSEVDSRIQEVLLEIERRKDEIPSNTELADIAYLSKDAFIRVFKKEIGMSPHQYILKQRIEEAAMQLLHNPHISIEQVAFACGFEDRNYFTRIFTKVIGLPPAKYRKSYMLGRT